MCNTKKHHRRSKEQAMKSVSGWTRAKKCERSILTLEHTHGNSADSKCWTRSTFQLHMKAKHARICKACSSNKINSQSGESHISVQTTNMTTTTQHNNKTTKQRNMLECTWECKTNKIRSVQSKQIGPESSRCNTKPDQTQNARLHKNNQTSKTIIQTNIMTVHKHKYTYMHIYLYTCIDEETIQLHNCIQILKWHNYTRKPTWTHLNQTQCNRGDNEIKACAPDRMKYNQSITIT